MHFQAIGEQQEAHRRLLQHLDYQQVQNSLAQARQLEEQRRMIDEAVGRNQSSADAVNRTIHAMLEHQRRPNADFEAALQRFASQLAAGQTERDIALGHTMDRLGSLEANAHRVLGYIEAMNAQQPSFEGLAAQNRVNQDLLQEIRLHQDRQGMDDEVVASAPAPGPMPPPPPPRRIRRSRSRERPPVTRANLEHSVRLSAAALRAHDFAPTLAYGQSQVAPTVARSNRPSVVTVNSSSRQSSAAPTVVVSRPASVAKPKAQTRVYSIATSEASEAPPKKVVAISGPSGQVRGRSGKATGSARRSITLPVVA
jgi:hypothetical protein